MHFTRKPTRKSFIPYSGSVKVMLGPDHRDWKLGILFSPVDWNYRQCYSCMVWHVSDMVWFFMAVGGGLDYLPCPWPQFTYGVRSLKFIWAPVYRCTHWLRSRNCPPPPAFGPVYEGAICQPRQMTTLCNPLPMANYYLPRLLLVEKQGEFAVIINICTIYIVQFEVRIQL